MSKVCAKCSKSVYPTEELKCLDKVWHKGCFRCWECNMTLNMKNYKGYDKKPYCSAHYPQTKATVVADTPELQRLAHNTKLQSQVKYHEEFEKKIKGSKIQISDDPETQRLKHLNSVVSEIEYKGIREKTGNMESRRQSLPPTSEKPDRWPFVRNNSQAEDPKSPISDRNTSTSIMYKADGKVEAPRQKRIGSIADYDPVNENYGSLAQGYNPVSRLSQSQEWEETIPVSPSGTPSKQAPVHVFEPDAEVEVKETAVEKVEEEEREEEPEVTQNDKPAEDDVKVTETKPLSGAYVALYDYEAQDEDEVGFNEGDQIIDCESVDAGWMIGTVLRTSERGMLPSNYVEQVI